MFATFDKPCSSWSPRVGLKAWNFQLPTPVMQFQTLEGQGGVE